MEHESEYFEDLRAELAREFPPEARQRPAGQQTLPAPSPCTQPREAVGWKTVWEGLERRYHAGLQSLLDRPDPAVEIKAAVADGDGYVVVATMGDSREAIAAQAASLAGPQERWLGHLSSLAGSCAVCGLDYRAVDLWGLALAGHSGEGYASDYRDLCEAHLPCPPGGTLPAGQLAALGLHAEEVVTLPPRLARAELAFRFRKAHSGSGRLMVWPLQDSSRCRLTVASRNGPEVTRWRLRWEDAERLIETHVLPGLAFSWLERSASWPRPGETADARYAALCAEQGALGARLRAITEEMADPEYDELRDRDLDEQLAVLRDSAAAGQPTGEELR